MASPRLPCGHLRGCTGDADGTYTYACTQCDLIIPVCEWCLVSNHDYAMAVYTSQTQGNHEFNPRAALARMKKGMHLSGLFTCSGCGSNSLRLDKVPDLNTLKDLRPVSKVQPTSSFQVKIEPASEVFKLPEPKQQTADEIARVKSEIEAVRQKKQKTKELVDDDPLLGFDRRALKKEKARLKRDLDTRAMDLAKREEALAVQQEHLQRQASKQTSIDIRKNTEYNTKMQAAQQIEAKANALLKTAKQLEVDFKYRLEQLAEKAEEVKQRSANLTTASSKVTQRAIELERWAEQLAMLQVKQEGEKKVLEQEKKEMEKVMEQEKKEMEQEKKEMAQNRENFDRKVMLALKTVKREALQSLGPWSDTEVYDSLRTMVDRVTADYASFATYGISSFLEDAVELEGQRISNLASDVAAAERLWLETRNRFVVTEMPLLE